MNKLNAVRRILQRGGTRLLYTGLLLFFSFKRKDLPGWARTIVIGVLGYLISPIDSVPDLTPFIGYTDDLGLLSYALVMIAAYVNDEVRQKAKIKLQQIMGSQLDKEALLSVEKIL